MKYHTKMSCAKSKIEGNLFNPLQFTAGISSLRTEALYQTRIEFEVRTLGTLRCRLGGRGSRVSPTFPEK